VCPFLPFDFDCSYSPRPVQVEDIGVLRCTFEGENAGFELDAKHVVIWCETETTVPGGDSPSDSLGVI